MREGQVSKQVYLILSSASELALTKQYWSCWATKSMRKKTTVELQVQLSISFFNPLCFTMTPALNDIELLSMLFIFQNNSSFEVSFLDEKY